MPCLGVLGGLGPAATIDFMQKLMAATPAERDQDHLSTIVLSLPQIPDRSAAVLKGQDAPLETLERGVETLNAMGVDLIAIPCNPSHHWYDQLAGISDVPILHIAQASVRALAPGQEVCLLATRGTLKSGFYQRACAKQSVRCRVPMDDETLLALERIIALVKVGSRQAAEQSFRRLLFSGPLSKDRTLLLGCTELPLAVDPLMRKHRCLVDATLELAVAAVTQLRPEITREDAIASAMRPLR